MSAFAAGGVEDAFGGEILDGDGGGVGAGGGDGVELGVDGGVDGLGGGVFGRRRAGAAGVMRLAGCWGGGCGGGFCWRGRVGCEVAGAVGVGDEVGVFAADGRD